MVGGVEEDKVASAHPRFMLASVQRPVYAACQFEAQLAILNHLSAGYSAVMYVHTRDL